MGLVFLGNIYVSMVKEFLVFSFLLFGNLMKLFGVLRNESELFFLLLGFIVGMIRFVFFGGFFLSIFFVLYFVLSGNRVIG